MQTMKKEELDFTVLDVETSGLDPQNDQIIEFAMIRVRAGEPVLVFNTLVNFQDELNPKITELTGHTIEDLQGGITEKQLALALDSLIDPDEVLIAYNAAFDLAFIEALYVRQLFDDSYGLPNYFVDPLVIARDRFPYPHKLADTARRFGITFEAHSAYEDTFALLDVVIALDKQHDISNYVNVLGYKTKYGKPSFCPPHAILKAQDGNKRNNSAALTDLKRPRRQANNTPVTPKADNVVTSKNTARKKRPTPEISDETMPTGLTFSKATLDRVNAFLDELSPQVTIPYADKLAVLDYIQSRTERAVESTAKGNMAVLSWVSGHGVTGAADTSWLDDPIDTPPKMHRVDVDPFDGGPIEISEDDLPF
jgi:DNA polymerase III subunit epsilon